MSSHSKPQRRNVKWNDDEMELLAQEMLRLYLDDMSGIVSLLGDAQLVLPEHRHRRIAASNMIPPFIKQRFVELRKQRLDQDGPTVVQIEMEIEPSRQKLLASITSTELFMLLGDRFGRLVSKIEGLDLPTVTKGTGEISAAPAPPAATPVDAPRKKRILLYGFDASQEAAIKDKAQNFPFELVFKPKNSPALPSCNWCIAMKIGSQNKAALKEAYEKTRFFLVDGTANALKKLADINATVHQH